MIGFPSRATIVESRKRVIRSAMPSMGGASIANASATRVALESIVSFQNLLAAICIWILRAEDPWLLFQALFSFQRTKWQAEELIRNSELSYVILKSSLVFGPQDSFLSRLEEALVGGKILLIPGYKASIFRPVAIEELISVLISAMHWLMNNAVSRFDARIPLTTSVSVFSNILDACRSSNWPGSRLVQPAEATKRAGAREREKVRAGAT